MTTQLLLNRDASQNLSTKIDFGVENNSWIERSTVIHVIYMSFYGKGSRSMTCTRRVLTVVAGNTIDNGIQFEPTGDF